MDSKNVVIYVAGQRFSIRTKDTEEYVISTGEAVDLRIKGIQNDNPRLNRDACAILAALDYCDDMRKLSTRVDVLREQVKDYLADSERLKSENANLKSEVARLKEEIKSIKEKSAGPVPVKASSMPTNQNSKQTPPYQNKPQQNQNQRYGVQSYSNTKEPKPQSTKDNYHQFSIFDKDLK